MKLPEAVMDDLVEQIGTYIDCGYQYDELEILLPERMQDEFGEQVLIAKFGGRTIFEFGEDSIIFHRHITTPCVRSKV